MVMYLNHQRLHQGSEMQAGVTKLTKTSARTKKKSCVSLKRGKNMREIQRKTIFTPTKRLHSICRIVTGLLFLFGEGSIIYFYGLWSSIYIKIVIGTIIYQFFNTIIDTKKKQSTLFRWIQKDRCDTIYSGKQSLQKNNIKFNMQLKQLFNIQKYRPSPCTCS